MTFHGRVTAADVFFLTWREIYMNIYELSSFHDQFGFLKPFKNSIYDLMKHTRVKQLGAAFSTSGATDEAPCVKRREEVVLCLIRILRHTDAKILWIWIFTGLLVHVDIKALHKY